MKFKRIAAHVSLSRLRQNFNAIHRQIKNQKLIPMIKANAYGHGINEISKTLANEKALYGFGVATFEEGEQVRKAISRKNNKLPIIVFSASSPWTQTKAQYCKRWNLTPVIFQMSDFKKFFRQHNHQSVDYHLQFNTGMNRLGIEMDEIQELKNRLSKMQNSILPKGILSHLAASESPTHPLSQKQLKNFKIVFSEMRNLLPDSIFHLANSGGIWNSSAWDLKNLTQCVRPGLSLYGIPPWEGAPKRKLKPVMALKTQVLQTHTLKRGDGLGYGFSFKAQRKIKIATLASGYGDGIPRILSNRAFVYGNKKNLKILGRVSMDVFASEAPLRAKPGQWVEIFGDHIPIWRQARAAQSIPYELLTSLTNRVPRIYSRPRG